MAAPTPLPPPLAAVGPTSLSTNHRLALSNNRHYQAMKKEGEPRLEASKTLSISRRDVLCLTGQSLAAVTFWSMEPKQAMARTVNRSEIKRKFMEKIKQLKEKAGFANPRDDNIDENNKIPKSSSDKVAQNNHLDHPIKSLVESVFP